jgi:hypothetical protein
MWIILPLGAVGRAAPHPRDQDPRSDEELERCSGTGGERNRRLRDAALLREIGRFTVGRLAQSLTEKGIPAELDRESGEIHLHGLASASLTVARSAWSS